jgi:hypothetical protein
MLESLQLCGIVLGCFIVVTVLSYTFVRVVTLAYFHSRVDYETLISKRRVHRHLPTQQLEGA